MTPNDISKRSRRDWSRVLLLPVLAPLPLVALAGVAVGRTAEPTAHRLRVAAPGGGSTVATMLPPRPVCQHGMLQFSSDARS